MRLRSISTEIYRRLSESSLQHFICTSGLPATNSDRSLRIGSRSETSKVRTGFSMIAVSFSRPCRRSAPPRHTFALFRRRSQWQAPLGAQRRGALTTNGSLFGELDRFCGQFAPARAAQRGTSGSTRSSLFYLFLGFFCFPTEGPHPDQALTRSAHGTAPVVASLLLGNLRCGAHIMLSPRLITLLIIASSPASWALAELRSRGGHCEDRVLCRAGAVRHFTFDARHARRFGRRL